MSMNVAGAAVTTEASTTRFLVGVVLEPARWEDN